MPKFDFYFQITQDNNVLAEICEQVHLGKVIEKNIVSK